MAIFDYPGVVDRKLLSLVSEKLPGFSAVVQPDFFRVREQKAGYYSGGDNPNDLDRCNVFVIRRSLADFFWHYIHSAHKLPLNVPGWVDQSAYIHWLFDCQETYIKRVIQMWLDRERYGLSHKVKQITGSFFRTKQQIEILPGCRYSPSTDIRLEESYRKALIQLALDQ